MKQSTFSAVMANNLLTVLQGYSKTIRLLLVMLLTLTVTTNAWAEEEALACPTGTIVSNTMTWDLTSCTIVHAKGSNNNYVANSPWRVYQGAIVTFTPKSNTSISEIVITATSSAYATAGTNTWTNATASASSSTITVTPTDGTKEISVTASAQTRWSNIAITYTTSGGGGSTTVDPEVTFSNGEYTIGGAALDLSTLWDSNSTGAVTYSVTNAGTTGATVNGTSFTATAAGTCTVQASQAATATHNAATATATITVTAPSGGGEECTWTLITNASDLNAGDKVVIAAKDYNYAISTTQNGNNRGQASVTKNTSNNTITFGDDVQILTLEEGNTSGTLAFYTGNGYLYAASSGSNYMRTETTLSDNSSWEITIADDGTATVVAQGTNTRNTMQYNQSSSIFSCYGSASQKAIVIYKEVCTGGSTETLVSVLPKIMNF